MILLSLFYFGGRESSLLLDDYAIYDTFDTDNINVDGMTLQSRSISGGCGVNCGAYISYCINREVHYDGNIVCTSEITAQSGTKMHPWGGDINIGYSDLWHSRTEGGPKIDILNGDLIWDGGSSMNLISTKDFKGMYVKLLIDGHRKLFTEKVHNYIYYTYKGEIKVNIGGLTYTLGGDSATFKDNPQPQLLDSYGLHMIEIKPSIIDPNYIEMWVNGQYYSSTTLSDSAKVNIKVTGSSYIEMPEVKYKVPFESCSQKGNRILITESFAGPQTFNEFKFRYSPAQYCTDHPVIITDSKKVGSAVTSEPYAKLSKGETFSIQSTQTYTFFYLAYNDGSIPMACEESSYSPERDRCEDVTAIVHLCSEGVFDPAIGSCVVNPESKYICEFGMYDVSLGMCVWNPPQHAICLEGSYNSVTQMCEVFPDVDYICEIGTFNYETDMCEYTPDTGAVCDDGYVYNSQTNKCEYEPPNTVICPYNTIYNPLTNICEQHPEQMVSCPGGYTYNLTSDKCEKHVVTSIFCDGEYDSETGLCVKEVVVSCPEGRLDFDSASGEYVCISEPDTEIFCPEGTYNELKEKCIIVPEYEIVDDDGQVTIQDIEDAEDAEEIVSGMDNNMLFLIIGGVLLLLLILMRKR